MTPPPPDVLGFLSLSSNQVRLTLITEGQIDFRSTEIGNNRIRVQLERERQGAGALITTETAASRASIVPHRSNQSFILRCINLQILIRRQP